MMDNQPLRRRITGRLPALWIAAVLALACFGTGLAAASASTSHAATKTKLAGKWKGRYSGAVSGHFTLNWTRTGKKLSGTIKLSNPNGKYGIDGTLLPHKKIKFGAVDVGAKYTGVWTGSKMSGSWSSPEGGGSWSAHKAS